MRNKNSPQQESTANGQLMRLQNLSTSVDFEEFVFDSVWIKFLHQHTKSLKSEVHSTPLRNYTNRETFEFVAEGFRYFRTRSSRDRQILVEPSYVLLLARFTATAAVFFYARTNTHTHTSSRSSARSRISFFSFAHRFPTTGTIGVFFRTITSTNTHICVGFTSVYSVCFCLYPQVCYCARWLLLFLETRSTSIIAKNLRKIQEQKQAPIDRVGKPPRETKGGKRWENWTCCTKAR